MKPEASAIRAQMTLEQKASLCSGRDMWHLEGFAELGVPSIMVADGPHGLRKQAGEGDHVGLNDSVPATCFPTASAVAASWDTELIEEMGRALGIECRAQGVAVLLGPGANIKRSPLCGRNFEYFSEDPYLTGALAAAFIRGVQSTGVGTSLKHFAVNNQEHRRMSIDAVVDERALREIYLAGFEAAVREAQPMTVMNAYNRVNGTYCSEHRELLTTILKEEWGHRGFVVTDWGAEDYRVAGLCAGQELEMPGPAAGNDRALVAAVRTGQLDESVLDGAVERILSVIRATTEELVEIPPCDLDRHHRQAQRTLAESAVLLSNNGILPLGPESTIAVIGAFARQPRYQGAGSSRVNPTRLDMAWDALSAEPALTVEYAAGYHPRREAADEALIAEAVALASRSDVAVLFAGLPEISESEGFDRSRLALPHGHERLIEAVAATGVPTVVVLSNGSPVAMPWIGRVAAVLETYLGGQGWGSAVADLLLGRVNPSGKLAESFTRSIEAVPSTPNFPGGTRSVAYAESIYVGYRYYDRAGTDLLFPFGHGMSYTSFDYHSLAIDGPAADGSVTVRLAVSNTGERFGKEVVQLYVRDVESTVYRPDKELAGFAKVAVEAGETSPVEVTLPRRAFSFWDSGARRWVLEAGEFEILVGASAADIRLSQRLTIAAGDELSPWAQALRERVPGYYEPSIDQFADLSASGEFAALLGRPVPPLDVDPGSQFTRYSTLYEVRRTFVGGLIYRRALKEARRMAGHKADSASIEMMTAVVRQLPLKSLAIVGGGMDSATIDAIVALVNGRLFAGLYRLYAARRHMRSS